MDKASRALFASVVILFGSILCFRQLSQANHLVVSDGVGYFSHLPSMLLDQDIDYSDEFAALGREGRNHWPIGTAIAWLPFYLLGHLVSRFAFGLNEGVAFAEQLACCLGSLVYGAAALVLCFQFACRWFDRRNALLGTLFLFAGSNLPYYLLCEPYMSHAVSVFWVSLLLKLGLTEKTPSTERCLLLGALTGLAALTRPQDGLFLLPILLWHAIRGQELRTPFRLGLVAGPVSLAVFSIQLSLWSRMPSAEVVPGGQYRWLNPDILGQLFGWHHGLFLWHPLCLMACLGLVALFWDKSNVAATALAGFGLQLYIIGVWGGQGQTFGGRMFVSCFPLLCLGLVHLIERAKQRVKWLYAVGALAALWNVFLIYRYRVIMRQGVDTWFQDMLEGFSL